MKCGIVGLPNVGKSSLFNAIIGKVQAESADYPFCTIEPNNARVAVHDPRLYELQKFVQSDIVVPETLDVVDIAGIVKGASEGVGMGNQFLGNIRNTNILLHVVRCFDKPDNPADPINDIEIINTELILADIDSLKKRKKLDKVKIREGIKSLEENGHFYEIDDLISNKPVIYIANGSLDDMANIKKMQEYATQKNIPFVSVFADIEMSLIGENKNALQEFGIQESSLDKIMNTAYANLGMKSFFTAGKKEVRIWKVHKDATAVECAAKIHTDIARGFIMAETTSYHDFLNGNKFRLEGKKYLVQEGDILNFRFNV